MNVILFGPPGAGKGTQANNIVKKYDLYKISTGDLLRDEIKKNTDVGKKITHDPWQLKSRMIYPVKYLKEKQKSSGMETT